MHFMQRANKHAHAYGKTIHKVIIAALHTPILTNKIQNKTAPATCAQ